MIKVVIADDHRLVAEGIARLINDTQQAEVVAIAGTLEKATEHIAEKQPQVLLLDVAMPDGDGIEALHSLQHRCPAMRVIIFTSFSEPSVVRRAMSSGAAGYLLKNASTRELLECLQEVADGKEYICRGVQVPANGWRETLPALTMREREVLALIVEGKTIKEIADQLCLGFETVHSYTKYLRQKLGVGNTASLVRVALERHLV